MSKSSETSQISGSSDTSRIVSENLQGILQGIHEVLYGLTGNHTPFCLVVFTDGRASYGSNCDIKDVMPELRHLLELWDAGMEHVPAHKVN